MWEQWGQADWGWVLWVMRRSTPHGELRRHAGQIVGVQSIPRRRCCSNGPDIWVIFILKCIASVYCRLLALRRLRDDDLCSSGIPDPDANINIWKSIILIAMSTGPVWGAGQANDSASSCCQQENRLVYLSLSYRSTHFMNRYWQTWVALTAKIPYSFSWTILLFLYQ